MKRIPQNEIYRILSGLAGTVGLYVEDCQSGEIFTINPEHVFPSASVIKVPMLALLIGTHSRGWWTWTPPTIDPPQPGGRDRHPVRAGHRLHPFPAGSGQADDRTQRQHRHQ